MPTYVWYGDRYLEHYGRKGMKWYEHIYGEEDPRGKYNSEQKRAAYTKKVISDFEEMYGRINKIRNLRKNPEQIRIQPGDILNRFTSNPHEIDTHKGKMYASYLDVDEKVYGTYVNQLGFTPVNDPRTAKKGDTIAYKMELRVDKELVAPSFRQVENTLYTIFDGVSQNELAKIFAKGNPDSKQFAKILKTLSKNRDVAELRDYADEMMMTWVLHTSLFDKLCESLSKQGYNMILDYEDAHDPYANLDKANPPERLGTVAKEFGNAQNPIIVFDRGETTTVKDVTAFTKGDMEKAEKDLNKYAFASAKEFFNEVKKYNKEHGKGWGIWHTILPRSRSTPIFMML